jgi:hypothetical protein
MRVINPDIGLTRDVFNQVNEQGRTRRYIELGIDEIFTEIIQHALRVDVNISPNLLCRRC